MESPKKKSLMYPAGLIAGAVVVLIACIYAPFSDEPNSPLGPVETVILGLIGVGLVFAGLRARRRANE